MTLPARQRQLPSPEVSRAAHGAVAAMICPSPSNTPVYALSRAFTRNEAVEFQQLFDSIAARLPAMFSSFWHRWEIAAEDPCALVIRADSGATSLRIERGHRGYSVSGYRGCERRQYVARMDSIAIALRACGIG